MHRSSSLTSNVARGPRSSSKLGGNPHPRLGHVHIFLGFVFGLFVFSFRFFFRSFLPVSFILHSLFRFLNFSVYTCRFVRYVVHRFHRPDNCAVQGQGHGICTSAVSQCVRHCARASQQGAGVCCPRDRLGRPPHPPALRTERSTRSFALARSRVASVDVETALHRRSPAPGA